MAANKQARMWIKNGMATSKTISLSSSLEVKVKLIFAKTSHSRKSRQIRIRLIGFTNLKKEKRWNGNKDKRCRTKPLDK